MESFQRSMIFLILCFCLVTLTQIRGTLKKIDTNLSQVELKD